MKLSKFTIFSISFLSAGVLFYAGLMFVVPAVLNSGLMVRKYEQIISKKTGFPVKIEGFKFRTLPNLAFDVNAGHILSKTEKGVDVINISDILYKTKPLSIKPKSVDVNDIYIDFTQIKSFMQSKDKESGENDFDLGYFPLLNVKHIYTKLDKDSYIEVTGLQSMKKDSVVFCKFLAKVDTPYNQTPIYVGREGYLYYSDNLYIDDLSIDFGSSKLTIAGEIENLNMFGQALPVEELERAFVFFYKIKHHGKKNFIENFHNMKGTLDVDLNFSKRGVNGKCRAHNLRADFSNYMIPVNLPLVDFYFQGLRVFARTKGTFGTEPVFTDFETRGIGTKNVHTRGNVYSKLTNKFSQKYFKPVQISGYADALVKYDVKGKDVNVYYYLGVDKGNNLISQYGNLDNIDKKRQIYAHTLKQGEKFYLKKYRYEFLGKDAKILLSGDGLFERIKGRYKPALMAVKTNGDIPVTVMKSFIKDFLDSGTFNADLKYDFKNKLLAGYLNLKNSRHSDYLYLSNTNIDVKNDVIKMNSEGTFFDSPITLTFNADNNFSSGLNIRDINIYLKKFYVKRGNLSSVQSDIQHKKSRFVRPSRGAADYNIVVQKGKIHVDEVIHSRFYLHDVEIQGKMKNHIVEFIIPETEYASGSLSAVGKYNVVKHSSDIHFLASEIDSNDVATKMFNLPEQFKGKAYATLHLMTKNKLNDIHAHATFAIKDGFLPKLGSREFVLNRPNKFKKALFFLNKPIKFTLSKITNIDFSKPNVFYSDLRGSFILNNDDVDCVRIFSQSEYLSMFIEGNYNIEKQIGNLCIWGRHNKVAERKIKIFKIPLSWIYKLVFKVERTKNLYQDKIKFIPPINAKPHEEALFRIRVNGNLNSNDIKVQMKDLR